MGQTCFVYKLYPTKAQVAALEQTLDLHRWLYNAALEHRKLAWRYAHRSVGYPEQNRELTLIRRDDPRYGQSSSSAQQRTLRRLDEAFAAFFRRLKAGQKPGYPRFKRKREFDTVEYTAGNGARMEAGGKRVFFHGVGSVKLRLYRPWQGTITAISFTRKASGWWLNLSCTVPEVAAEPSSLPAVGIDLGLRAMVATDAGELIAPPRRYEQGLRKLRRLQRRVARRQRGSGRRRTAVQLLAREQERIANRRRDWQRKTAKDLAERFGAVAVEDLSVARLVSTPKARHRYPWARTGLNRGVHDAAWASFVPILERRLAERGGRLVAVDPADTSQLCSRCGATHNPPISIFERTYRCQYCGMEEHADVNSARNIRKRALI